jgi:DNA-binding FadR family transcriptional regulator
LEIGVAGLAALRASPKQIADMEEILEAHGAALAARRDGRALEREFHRRLWRAADNPSAERILNELELHIEDRSRLASDLTVLRHHEATLRALVLRFDVAVVMAQHLQHEDASRLGDA